MKKAIRGFLYAAMVVTLGFSTGCEIDKYLKDSPIGQKDVNSLDGAKWIKGTPGPVNAKLNAVTLKREGGNPIATLSYDKLPWKAIVGQSGKNIIGSVSCFFMRDGRWTGGFVEGMKPGDTVRDLHNIDPGNYLPGLKPKKGEKVLICLSSRVPGEGMSNAIASVWP